MKKVLPLMMIMISSYAMSQTDTTTTIYKDSSFSSVGYVTPNMDTLYILDEMYDEILSVWVDPNYDYNYKMPVIIPVETLYGIKPSKAKLD